MSATPMKWSQTAAFINRRQEIRYLQSWISEEPGSILFLYGPKSSGKTTLLHKFISENQSERQFDIKHFNLREILLVNYEDFIQAFFELDYSKSKEDIKERREYDLRVFKLSTEILKGLDQKQLDPFIVMKQELTKAAERGLQPIIIIDELQALEGIYLNGQRELLKELFNFFVAITKESHLCHVIIASSDGYFIERIYKDSKLKKTSKFLEVDYLDKKDVITWLADLKKYSNITAFTLTDSQREAIWQAFGGSCWEISAFLGDLLIKAEDGSITEKQITDLILKKQIAARSFFEEYAGLSSHKTQLLHSINTIHSKKGRLKLTDFKGLVEDHIFTETQIRAELRELVRHNFLAYDPVIAEYKIQGKCMEAGLKMFVEMEHTA